MKTNLLLTIVSFIGISCNSNHDLDGYWKVDSDFYKATYHIQEVDNQTKAHIVSYNDGTTKYTSETRPNQFLFNNLKKKDDVYVDAISGATKTSSKGNTNHIRIKHKDTLEVTTYLMNKPLTEFWIRTTK